MSATDIVIIGAGAAGLAASKALTDAGTRHVVLEARERAGGRAWTVMHGVHALDMGCGWLHSADKNPLVAPIEAAGFTIDKTPPHWERPAVPAANISQAFTPAEQQDFAAAREAFEQRLEEAARGRDRPAADFLEPGGRWNAMLDEVSGYYNGAPLRAVSVHDYAAYEDTQINWRVAEGYGAALLALADLGRVRFGCAVRRVRHDGPRVVVETPQGDLEARAAIIAVPTSMISGGALNFHPALPDKQVAAAGLPLGLADKAFLALSGDVDFSANASLRSDAPGGRNLSYQFRPFGRSYIEAFTGGDIAEGLSAEGDGALTAHAIEELGRLMGSDFKQRLRPIAQTMWRRDPFALGAYSHALPGHAGDRAVLAAPVDGRLFFAGEATSPNFFSTCHGAWESGLRAAKEALAAGAA